MSKPGRIIAITGATGGVAQAFIAGLAPEDRVLAIGRNAAKLKELYGDKEQVSYYTVDMQDASAIEDLVEELYQAFGRIDVFVNNAGFGEFKAYDAFDAQTIQEMMAVNTLAVIHFSRLVGHRMAEQGSGHIMTVASMAGKVATAKSSVYGATKFAVIGYSNALRLELADANVFVTTVNPGPISTGFFDRADPSGQYLKSVASFTLTPEQVASKMIGALGKNKRELNMPFSLRVTAVFYSLFPRLSDFLSRKVFNYK